MKPLSDEELTKCAENAWFEYNEYDSQFRVLPTSTVFIDAYKQGYIKCVAQMQDEFNELLKACYTSLRNQTKVDINEIINQMKGGNDE